MTKKQKKTLIRIIVSFVLFAAVFTAEHLGAAELLPCPWFMLFPYLAVYLLIGHDILIKAFKNICHGQVFDENFLMTVATIAAFVVGEYFFLSISQ